MLDLQSSTLYLCIFINDNVSSSAEKSFGSCKQSGKKLCGAFITHINSDPVISTDQAHDKLKQLYEQL